MRVSSRDTKGFTKQVGAKIKRVRERAGLSQMCLAAKIEMKGGALCNIERGNVSAHITTLKQIADALDVNIKVFL